MRPVAPRVGLPEVTIAEEQEAYMLLTVAPFQDVKGLKGVISRWRPTPAEREALAAGEDVYVMHCTFGGPLQPLRLDVGRPPWAAPEQDPGEPVTGDEGG